MPTRDLVVQVTNTFLQLTKDTRLKVASLYGEKSFAKEQQILVGSTEECKYVFDCDCVA